MINAETELFCVIGNPVSHSLSPLMHNLAFDVCQYNGIYTAFTVTDLKSTVMGIRSLGIKGVSVTIPHKIIVMDLLDAVDSEAEKIGAVNTIMNQDGKLIGYNTDCVGVVLSLKEKSDIKNKKIAIIGAGGAARAAGFGVKKQGADILIVNRTDGTGEALARDLGAEYMNIQEFQGNQIDILINTTPVGMHPNLNECPVHRDCLIDCSVVMDIIYNPLKTKLLMLAEENGCDIINGVSMFAFQGAEQFSIWTGIEPPVEKMKEIVTQNLK